MKYILTQDQSSRLIELGVDKKLASEIEEIDVTDANDPNHFLETDYYRLFTFTDLLSILPKKITDRNKIYELKMWVDHYSDAWCIEYCHNSCCNDLDDSFHSAEELADAIHAMLVWLKSEDNKNLVWL